MVYKKRVKITNNWNACVACGTVDEPRYGVEMWMAGYRIGMAEGYEAVCVKCYSED